MQVRISMYSRCNISSKIGHQYSVGKTVCALHVSRSEQNKIAIICAIRPLVNSIYTMVDSFQSCPKVFKILIEGLILQVNV